MKIDTATATRKQRDATPFLPENPRAPLTQLRQAAQSCRGCDLYKNATQAVFGEGKSTARIILIGEQPGDQEDLQGQAFVGPAGKVLDRALEEIGLDRSLTYVTNAVKHFKWKPAPRGKRRLHSKPGSREIHACHPWLERESFLIKPAVIVCMGVTAGQAILGKAFKLGESRSRIIHDPRWSAAIIATAHPSAILRVPTHEDREREYRAFVADLKLAQKAAQS
jgi:DNA polymerase